MKVMVLVGLVIGLASYDLAQAEPVKVEGADTNVIAVVLGKKITAKEKDQLNGIIFGTLLQQYAKKHRIEPTDEELDAFVRRTEAMDKRRHAKLERDRERLKKELKSASLSDRDREGKQSELATIESILKSTRELKEQTKGADVMARSANRRIAHQFVMSWKINKALYAEYGGRIIFQQAGVEPLDAYRNFLKDQEKKGAFRIMDKQYEPGFWRYFTNDAMHTFYEKGDGATFINTPWWMMDEPPEE